MEKAFIRLMAMFLLVAIVGYYGTGCVPVMGKPSMISNLEASNLYVYPFGKTTITYTASDHDGGDLTYSWSSTDGKIEGEGSQIIWTAPNQYGNFFIMVTVQTTSGAIEQKAIKITVVPNDNPTTTCPRCGG